MAPAWIFRTAPIPGHLRQTDRRCFTAPSTISVFIAIAWPRWSAWFAFGYLAISDPAAEALAENLGLAFQLTNIIRDVKEDAGMGRIYLPAEDLDRFKIAPSEFRQAAIPERLRWLLAAEADRAREYYDAARELMLLIDEDSQPALWVLVTIYRRLLEKISERKYDVFGKKIKLTVREKVIILGKGLVKRLA